MLASSLRLIPFFLALTPVSAEFTLAPLFQDGAVVQRDKPVPVWGTAAPGAKVAVTFAGQSKEAQADANGRWLLSLDPLETSAESRTLTAHSEGSPDLVCQDVLVGEVWLASGQSNMQWAISQAREEDQRMAAEGPVPLLRLFQVPRTLSHERRDRVDAKWQPATPETVRDFSAVGYFFGRKLAEEIKVPVGILHSSWGGSRIEPWWAEEGLEGIEELAKIRGERLLRSPGFPEYDKSYLAFIGNMRAWTDSAEAAVRAGRPVPEMPAAPARLGLGHDKEAGTYQAMIHPLAPFALRGFLWYQGESNLGDGMLYTVKMKALIHGWRRKFQAPDAPFLFVQLAPFRYGDRPADLLPGIWEAQQAALAIPHTGMASTMDIGNPRDIHPANKSEVGHRLARWALADTYGKTGIVKSGPLFSSFETQNGSLVIRFDHTGGGLTTRDGKEPTHFEIAGPDGAFQPARAEIAADGRSAILTSETIPRPTQARFAWTDTAEPNLMNKEGLPAGAFRTHRPEAAE